MSIRHYQDKYPRIAQTAYVDESAVVIGDVAIGEHSSLWPVVVACGDVNSIVIGDYTNIQDGTVLHVTHAGEFSPGGRGLRIGNHVTVGHRAILHGCQVGNHCLIGMASTVMDGAILEPKVFLGADSLVSTGKVLEGGYLWMGSPARKVRPLTERELASLDYSAKHYARLKDKYMQSQAEEFGK
jgi:carbonic anhydrase/acetyltransferase-like protein (isoleucine patch superfamily)